MKSITSRTLMVLAGLTLLLDHGTGRAAEPREATFVHPLTIDIPGPAWKTRIRVPGPKAEIEEWLYDEDGKEIDHRSSATVPFVLYHHGGAVGALKTQVGYFDYWTRWVDSNTGKVMIQKIMITVNGVEYESVAAWTRLATIDPRFKISTGEEGKERNPNR